MTTDVLGLSGPGGVERKGVERAQKSEGDASAAVKILIAALFVAVLALGYGLYSVSKTVSRNQSLRDVINGSVKSRIDSGDERYKRLKSEIEVLAGGLKLTKQELASRAAALQKHQAEETARLQNELAQAKKDSAAGINKAQTDATNKFGKLSSDIAGTQMDLDATKDALRGAKRTFGSRCPNARRTRGTCPQNRPRLF